MKEAETRLTEAALRLLEGAPDARLRQVVAALTRHLHAFVREVEPTEKEWLAGIRFLTETGKRCDGLRQEFILLSDVLGASMLVDAINHRLPEGATESSVLGPFHRPGAPERALGDSISGDTEGEAVTVSGRVLDTGGRPLAGALLDVWQTAPSGRYEGQNPDQPPFNLRGRFRTDGDGGYRFRTVAPVSYPIPDDGPAGALLRAVGRHPFRPAHIHFIVAADGYRTLVTQLFTRGDPYIDSDAVFGVKDSLVVDYRPTPDGLALRHDFVLAKG